MNCVSSRKLLPLDFSQVLPNEDFPVQPNYPALPPHLYQPSQGLPFNPTTYVAIPAVGASATIIRPEEWKPTNVICPRVQQRCAHEL